MCYLLCKEEKVIINNKEFIIRFPKMEDVYSFVSFFNSLVQEEARITKNEKVTIEEEKDWLKSIIKKIESNKLHCICVFYGNKLVANLEVNKLGYRASHVAVLAIAVDKEFRNQGLAKFLLNKAIHISKNDKDIKVLTLDVFETNTIAINLYKKMGFREVARLPKRIYYHGKLIDIITMDYYFD